MPPQPPQPEPCEKAEALSAAKIGLRKQKQRRWMLSKLRGTASAPSFWGMTMVFWVV